MKCDIWLVPGVCSRFESTVSPLKKDFLYSVSGFVLLYMICLLGVTMVVSWFGADLATGFTTALVTVGNIGPGFGKIGPHNELCVLPSFC